MNLLRAWSVGLQFSMSRIDFKCKSELLNCIAFFMTKLSDADINIINAVKDDFI